MRVCSRERQQSTRHRAANRLGYGRSHPWLVGRSHSPARPLPSSAASTSSPGLSARLGCLAHPRADRRHLWPAVIAVVAIVLSALLLASGADVAAAQTVSAARR
jgi:hypothetical protein